MALYDFVRGQAGNFSSTSASFNVVVAPTAGNTLVVWVETYLVTSPATRTVTDSLGQTWFPAGSRAFQFYYCPNCLGSTLTVLISSPGDSHVAGLYLEYEGTFSFEGTNDAYAGSNVSDPVVVGPVTVSTPSLVLCGLSARDSPVSSLSFTPRLSNVADTNFFQMTVGDIRASSGTATLTASGAGQYWASQIAVMNNGSGPPATDEQPIVKRLGGVPSMGGQGLGNKGPGRMWGRTREGIYVPRRFAA